MGNNWNIWLLIDFSIWKKIRIGNNKNKLPLTEFTLSLLQLYKENALPVENLVSIEKSRLKVSTFSNLLIMNVTLKKIVSNFIEK